MSVGKGKDLRKAKKKHSVRLNDGTEVERGARSETHSRAYASAGLKDRPNGAFGRNRGVSGAPAVEAMARDEVVAAEAEAKTGGGDVVPADQVSADELRALRGKPRSTGVAPPPRLTAKQQRVVKALLDAHGDDLEKMARDRKRNAMQHTPAVLARLVRSYLRHHAGSPSGPSPSAPWAWWTQRAAAARQ